MEVGNPTKCSFNDAGLNFYLSWAQLVTANQQATYLPLTATLKAKFGPFHHPNLLSGVLDIAIGYSNIDTLLLYLYVKIELDLDTPLLR